MKKILRIIALPLFLFVLVASTVQAANKWTVGVEAGDYFTYEMYGVYHSNHPEVGLDIPEFEYNNTDWTRINVTSTQGSIVNQVYTLRYKNGSEVIFSFTCDVNPESNLGLAFNQKGVPLCPADLQVGDTVPTGQTVIDETMARSYSSGYRETNHAAWNSTADWGDIYFDRQTGMLVELCRTHKFQSDTTNEVVFKTDVIKIIETNRWQVKAVPAQQPANFYFAIVSMALFGVLATLVTAQRQHFKNVQR